MRRLRSQPKGPKAAAASAVTLKVSTLSKPAPGSVSSAAVAASGSRNGSSQPAAVTTTSSKEDNSAAEEPEDMRPAARRPTQEAESVSVARAGLSRAGKEQGGGLAKRHGQQARGALVTLKLVYGGDDIRRAEMPLGCSFSELRQIVQATFPASKAVLIKYRDVEGDLVTMTSSHELREAEASRWAGPGFTAAEEKVAEQAGTGVAVVDTPVACRPLKLWVTEVAPECEPAISEDDSTCDSEHEEMADKSEPMAAALATQDLAVVEDESEKCKATNAGSGRRVEEEEPGVVETVLDEFVWDFVDLFKARLGIDLLMTNEQIKFGADDLQAAFEKTVQSEAAGPLLERALTHYQDAFGLAGYNWVQGQLVLARHRLQPPGKLRAGDAESLPSKPEGGELGGSELGCSKDSDGNAEETDGKPEVDTSDEDKTKRKEALGLAIEQYEQAIATMEAIGSLIPNYLDGYLLLATARTDLAKFLAEKGELEGVEDPSHQTYALLQAAKQCFASAEKELVRLEKEEREHMLRDDAATTTSSKDKPEGTDGMMGTVEDGGDRKHQSRLDDILSYQGQVASQHAGVALELSKLECARGDPQWRVLLDEAARHYRLSGLTEKEVEETLRQHPRHTSSGGADVEVRESSGEGDQTTTALPCEVQHAESTTDAPETQGKEKEADAPTSSNAEVVDGSPIQATNGAVELVHSNGDLAEDLNPLILDNEEGSTAPEDSSERDGEVDEKCLSKSSKRRRNRKLSALRAGASSTHGT
eukprot:SM000028S10145  [mRNA]  locus=s28:587594:591263:+ [translate_table: standard]